jgi:hypothetical protein
MTPTPRRKGAPSTLSTCRSTRTNHNLEPRITSRDVNSGPREENGTQIATDGDERPEATRHVQSAEGDGDTGAALQMHGGQQRQVDQTCPPMPTTWGTCDANAINPDGPVDASPNIDAEEARTR